MSLKRTAAAVALTAGLLIPATPFAENAHEAPVRLTIYANGLALVDEAVTLPAGDDVIRLDGVAPQMVADSVRLDLGKAGMVREIALDSDILTERALLERSLGETVKVARMNPATGIEEIEIAEVLSVMGGVVLRIGDRIETTVPGRLIFDDVPEDLRAEPGLSVRLSTPLDAPIGARLGYLTNGMSWNAVYTVVLNDAHDRMDLDGWAKLSNNSGLDIGPAQISVVAGDVNRAKAAPPPGRILMRAQAMAADVSESAPEPQALSAFHLYTLPGDITLHDNETKQVALLGADNIAATRILEYHGGAPVFGLTRGPNDPEPVRQSVEIENAGDNDLGIPIPAGITRAYVRGADGALRFIGEDQVGNTAAGDTLRLDLGRAFDVTVKRQQTDFSRLGDRTTETAFTLTLNNGGDAAATVRVTEDIPGDWEILEQSAEHTRNGIAATWTVSVPANGKTDLTYRVRVRR